MSPASRTSSNAVVRPAREPRGPVRTCPGRAARPPPRPPPRPPHRADEIELREHVPLRALRADARGGDVPLHGAEALVPRDGAGEERVERLQGGIPRGGGGGP